MPHDFEGLEWANNHAAFSTALAGIFTTVLRGFNRLSARKFDAPWQAEPRTRECSDL